MASLACKTPLLLRRQIHSLQPQHAVQPPRSRWSSPGLRQRLSHHCVWLHSGPTRWSVHSAAPALSCPVLSSQQCGVPSQMLLSVHCRWSSAGEPHSYRLRLLLAVSSLRADGSEHSAGWDRVLINFVLKPRKHLDTAALCSLTYEKFLLDFPHLLWMQNWDGSSVISNINELL